MGVPRSLGYAAALAAGALAAPALGQQQATTDCDTVAGVTHCTTTTTQNRPPLDYGKLLETGRTLVPPIEPTSPPPRPIPATPPDPNLPQRSAVTFVQTGNDLLALCDADQVSCAFYMQGLYSGFSDGVSFSNGKAVVCPPPEATLGQTVDIVKAYLVANPSVRHEDAGALAIAALHKAFPCQ